MKFDINQVEFPSTTHKSIWHAAVFLAPFCEVLSPNLKNSEAENLLDGEKSFYSFMIDLYSDMYNNPKTYYLPVGEYDRFMNGRNRNDLLDKEKQKESRLRSKLQKSIQFYQKLLFEIGTKAELEVGSGIVTIDKSVLSDIIGIYKFGSLQGEIEKRVRALSDVGMEIKQSKNKLTISNCKYPKIFYALLALCKSNNNGFILTNFLRCDFRGIMNSYKPGFDDTVLILTDDAKKNAIEMFDFMRSLKCWIKIEPLNNTTLFSEWKVWFKLKDKVIYSFNSDINTLKVFAHFNDYMSLSRMGYRLREESGTLYNWFNDRISTRLCSCPNNKIVDIGGNKKRVCGLDNTINVIYPNSHDLHNLKRVIEIYINGFVK